MVKTAVIAVMLTAMLMLGAPGWAQDSGPGAPFLLAQSSTYSFTTGGITLADRDDPTLAASASGALSHYGWWKPAARQRFVASDKQDRAEQGTWQPAAVTNLPGLAGALGASGPSLLGQDHYRFAWSSYQLPASAAPWRSLRSQQKKSAFSARLLAHRGNAPGATLPSNMAGASYIGYDPQREETEQQGGYLALEWRSGPMGVTIGGGVSRSHTASPGSGPAAYSLNRSIGGGSAQGSHSFETNNRWGAFVAMPYQISDRVGLLSEFSYFGGQDPNASTPADNEWVLGLQFRFGF